MIGFRRGTLPYLGNLSFIFMSFRFPAIFLQEFLIPEENIVLQPTFIEQTVY